MKNKKVFLAIIAILVLACTFAFAACDPEEADNSTDKALGLVSACDTTRVELTKGETVYFSFEKTGDGEAVVSDPYGTGISADKFIDFSKDIKSSVSSSDIEVTEKTYNEETGDITLKATFKDADKTLGVEATDATLVIKGNIVSNTLEEYSITYIDANGYNVAVTLS